VHVQSSRKPDRSFCGLPIRSAPDGEAPNLAYVSVVVANRLSRSGSEEFDICAGCRENLERYEVAVARRRLSGAGGTALAKPASVPVARKNGKNEKREVASDHRRSSSDSSLRLPAPAPTGEDDLD
jgi:hypothetical protein